MGFNHREIEAKWQKYWEEHQTFKTDVWDFRMTGIESMQHVMKIITNGHNGFLNNFIMMV